MSKPPPARKRAPKPELRIHPACALFPDLDPESFEELVADIKDHGCHVPVVLYKGEVLDGKNRLRACQFLNLKCPTTTWQPKDGESVVEYVVSLNLIRRQLDHAQRSAIGAKMKAAYAEEAKEKQRSRTPTPKVARVPPPPLGKSRDRAAKTMGVSPRSVQDAEKVMQSDPEAFAKLEKGEITVGQAKRKSRPPPPARKPKAKPVLDGLGFEAKHPGLREALESAGELKQIVNDIIKCRSRLRKFCEAGSQATRCVHHQTVDTDLRNAFTHLKFAVPFTICGYCGGRRGCKACDGSGWVTEKIFKVTPREMQAAVKRELAKQSASKAE